MAGTMAGLGMERNENPPKEPAKTSAGCSESGVSGGNGGNGGSLSMRDDFVHDFQRRLRHRPVWADRSADIRRLGRQEKML